jgi:histidine decarboxylase
MKDLAEKMRPHLQTCIGYPLNTTYDYSKILHTLKVNLNNVGCPFVKSSIRFETKDIEKDVLMFFSELWSIKRENVWGYITNSGTEGNLQGLYVGREFLLSKGKEVVFYTSRDSHYSIFKIARLLNLNVCLVKSLDNGEIDYGDFENNLIQNQGKAALINANLGTTMKGGMDDIRHLYRLIKYHNMQNDYYMHVDGALMGFVVPFLQKDLHLARFAQSMSISGHKFLGIPFPCGVFLMEKQFLTSISKPIEYIGSLDCTISGSRNGHSPLFFKHIIDQKGLEGFRTDIETCLTNAEYLTESLPNAWRNQNSITVVFPKPSSKIIYKWQLAIHDDIAHVVVMPHVTKDVLDLFIADMLED